MNIGRMRIDIEKAIRVLVPEGAMFSPAEIADAAGTTGKSVYSVGAAMRELRKAGILVMVQPGLKANFTLYKLNAKESK